MTDPPVPQGDGQTPLPVDDVKAWIECGTCGPDEIVARLEDQVPDRADLDGSTRCGPGIDRR